MQPLRNIIKETFTKSTKKAGKRFNFKPGNFGVSSI